MSEPTPPPTNPNTPRCRTPDASEGGDTPSVEDQLEDLTNLVLAIAEFLGVPEE